VNECPAAGRRKGGFLLLILADESGNLGEIFDESCARVHGTKVGRYLP